MLLPFPTTTSNLVVSAQMIQTYSEAFTDPSSMNNFLLYALYILFTFEYDTKVDGRIKLSGLNTESANYLSLLPLSSLFCKMGISIVTIF